jgi:hypothetical protein
LKVRADGMVAAPPHDALASLAGVSAALLHLAGALKSIPLIGALPIDFTIFSAALALPLLALCAITRRWVLAPETGLPLAAIGAFWLWLVLAGCWSASGAVLSSKLPETHRCQSRTCTWNSHSTIYIGTTMQTEPHKPPFWQQSISVLVCLPRRTPVLASRLSFYAGIQTDPLHACTDPASEAMPR